MKNRLRKTLVAAGMSCMMCLAVNGCGESSEAPQAEQVQNESNDVPESELAGMPQENPEEEVKEEQEELMGDIQTIEDGSFVVAEIYTETVQTEEGTGEVMVIGAPGNEEDMNMIRVVYDENTVFTKKTIWDGGAHYEETEGSAADLKEDFTAEMQGSYEGDEFHASEVVIVEVIL